MDKKEKQSFQSKYGLWIGILSLFYLIVFTLYFSYLGLGTFGPQYSFAFALLIGYTSIAMGGFTFLRIWILKNKKILPKRGIIQLSFMWFMSLMFIGVGVSLPAHFVIINSFTAEGALIIAVVAATSFWVIETTTKTTVDILTAESIKA
ncbi:MAG: hypothetical protein M1476_02670 [Candidatus Thermoplasmatota archaeon]|nr:hypothetical protein [Candidatus Thermoplasmatota archaeon]